VPINASTSFTVRQFIFDEQPNESVRFFQDFSIGPLVSKQIINVQEISLAIHRSLLSPEIVSSFEPFSCALTQNLVRGVCGADSDMRGLLLVPSVRDSVSRSWISLAARHSTASETNRTQGGAIHQRHAWRSDLASGAGLVL
jgi:hypothetical protein